MKPLRRVIPFAMSLLLPAAAMAAGGMPQMDFKNPLTLSQVVWGAIIFIVLYIVASRFALPKVGSVLEERAAHIARDLEAAQASKIQADAGTAEAIAAIAKARNESQAAINAALDTAKGAAAEQSAVLNARLEKQLADAEGQIAQARTQAMSALREVATETAATVVARLTGQAPDPQRLSGAIGAALTARGVG
ncbi:MAG: F0F1 ATP synthase subunit B' [Rhodospirillales bacterium]